MNTDILQTLEESKKLLLQTQVKLSISGKGDFDPFTVHMYTVQYSTARMNLPVTNILKCNTK